MSGGVESNAPNTVNSSCADGNSGTYHSDESIDRMKIATNDSSALAAGKAVTATFTTYCYSSADKLDVYYTSNATTPSWTLVGTQSCTAAGVKTFTATYTLPSGANQAVRGTFRYNGSASACGTNSGYDDHDDLVFGVQ
jgi:leucyl aminopeptidase